MKKTFLMVAILILMVACTHEIEVDYHEKATMARIELTAKGLIVSDAVIEDENVRFSVLLANSENSTLLEGKAVQNPIVSVIWTINTTKEEVFGGHVPTDEQKMKDISVLWLYTYIFDKEAH